MKRQLKFSTDLLSVYYRLPYPVRNAYRSVGGLAVISMTRWITVQDPRTRDKLETLSPGAVVRLTYPESLAIRLEKVASK